MKTKHFVAIAAIVYSILHESPTALAQNTSQSSAYSGAGAHSLYPTVGQFNGAFGFNAMYNAYGGAYNTAVGTVALALLTSGNFNVAVGYAALYTNNSGYNTAIGSQALAYSTSSGNTAVGCLAGYNITTGNNNLALGYQAGSNITTGTFNIDIAHAGVAGDSGIIRIGTPGNQTVTYIAGAVRIVPKGDLLMGQFMTGTPPQ